MDGRLSPSLSAPDGAGDGILVMGMREALEQPPDAFEAHFGRYADRRDFAFAALNTAFVTDGAFVHLRRRASARHPIHLVFVSSGRESDVVCHPRVLIVAEVASRAQVVEHFIDAGTGARCFNNAVSEVVLKAGACVEHYKAQMEGDHTFHISSVEVHQAHESHFTSHVTSLGGRLVRHDINVRLEAPRAPCDLHGLYLAAGRQHMDFHTRVDHLVPECTSSEVYKGVLDGRARGVFNGRVYVHPDAQKSDAHQSQRQSSALPARGDRYQTTARDPCRRRKVLARSDGGTARRADDVLSPLPAASTKRAPERFSPSDFSKRCWSRFSIPWLRESLTREIAGRMPGALLLADTHPTGDIAVMSSASSEDRPGRNLYDVEARRRDFPVLHQEVHGRPLVYLDNGATSQKPRSVIEALRHYYEHDNSNVHRGVHALSERATRDYEAARDEVARFVNAPDRRAVVFVRGNHRSHQSRGAELPPAPVCTKAMKSSSRTWSITPTSCLGRCCARRAERACG